MQIYFLCIGRWQTTGVFPSQLQEARQESFPKARKRDKDGALEVKNLRPTTVMSSFWRIWASMWLQCASLQNWHQQVVPAWIAGGKGGMLLAAVVSPLWLHCSGRSGESGHCPWCGHASDLDAFGLGLQTTSSSPAIKPFDGPFWLANAQPTAECSLFAMAGFCPAGALALPRGLLVLRRLLWCCKEFKAYGILSTTQLNAFATKG